MAQRGLQTELQLYLREVNTVALLTPVEEKELGWRIINDNDLEAKERMIRANLRLVIAIGKNYMNRGLTLPDLIEEGNVGLIRAVEGFDPAQGARFSTYASWWIKQSIKRTLINAVQPIHVPAYMVDLIGRYKDARRLLADRLGRQAHPHELAEELALPIRKVKIIRRAIKAFNAPNSAPQGENGETIDFAELCPDKRQSCAEDQVAEREEFSVLLQLLDKIDARDARILKLRFGLEGKQPLTLKEIGKEIGLTRERVRQIQVEALQKLQAQLMDDKPMRFLSRIAPQVTRRRAS